MKKIMLLISLFIFVSGCSESPVSVSETTNSKVSVDTLFEHNGCTVYRFYDAGRLHYYSVCRSSYESEVISSYKVSCGKSCTSTKSDNIKTYGSGDF